DIRPHIDGGKRLAPIAVEAHVLHDATPAVTVIVGDEPVDISLAGNLLQAGVERGAHGEAAAVKLVLAEDVDDVAAYFLGEEFRGGEPRAGGTHLNTERLSLSSLAVLLGDVTVLDHAVDHPVAALDRPLGIAERVIVAGRFGKGGEIGAVGDR